MAAAGLWTPTNTALSKIANGQFDIDTDTYKMALFTSTTNLGIASTTYAALTNEVANANGYTTGGQGVTMTITTGTATAVSDAVWGTPTGNSVVITSAGNNLPIIPANSMFRVRASAGNPANEGLYFATATSTAGSLSAIKIGSAPVAATSAAANVKVPDTIQIPTNTVWTATGALAARYAAIYEVSGDVLAYCLLDTTPADVSVTSGNQLTVDADGTPSPVFSLI